jgi:hypothetical protein
MYVCVGIAAVVTAGILFHVGDSSCMCMHLLRTQAPKTKMPPGRLLRSLAGLGGVSDSTLAKQLAWIRENPEVLCATCIYMV